MGAPQSGRYFDTISPSTEEKLAEVAEADERDVDRAVTAARHAYEKYWSKLQADRARQVHLPHRARHPGEARASSRSSSRWTAASRSRSRATSTCRSRRHFFYYAGWADKLAYAFPGGNAPPLGVAGQVIPWNFPLLMAAWKLAPALACGNTCVLKPAETTPLTALLLAKIIEEATCPLAW
jgi:aldehyde dehydrogenase (NAD+)